MAIDFKLRRRLTTDVVTTGPGGGVAGAVGSTVGNAAAKDPVFCGRFVADLFGFKPGRSRYACFVLVALFNLARNSLVINFGLFSIGI